jgi:hypothetical protein
MRGLEREEEDLEEAVSHLSIYLNGLDHLYQEEAQQLKQQIDRAERAEQRIELERIKTTMAEVELHNTMREYLRERERTLLANKALWDEVKERRRRERKKLDWRKMNSKKLIGIKGPRLRKRYRSKTSRQRSVASSWRKNHHKDKTRMFRLKLCSSNNKCTPKSVP